MCISITDFSEVFKFLRAPFVINLIIDFWINITYILQAKVWEVI